MIEAKRVASANSNDPLFTPTRSFPVYDGHGNMIATLARTSAGGYSLANEKCYDVWGGFGRGSLSPTHAGSHIVNPNTGYCANLGHKFDGESDMLYMRARYYEPSTGRFISKDPAGDGANWYVYTENTPTMACDPSGKWSLEIGGYWFRLDHAYLESGTGREVRDLTWGVIRRGQPVQMGAVKADGVRKHGDPMPESVKKLLKGDPNAMKKLNKIGHFGLRAYVLVVSLDAAFASDPKGFALMCNDIGATLSLFSGFITVVGDGDGS